MNLKVNFLSQINPLRVSGGGEMINRELIEAGREMGHEIRLCAAYPEAENDHFDEADIYILSDVQNQPTAKQRLDKNMLREIIRDRPFLHLDNAYVDCCDLPYLPCNGNTDGRTCSFKNSLGAQRRRMLKRRGCFAAETREMYTNSLLNVFLSPLHRMTTQKIIGPEAVGAYYELRPTIDTALFVNEERQRDIGNLFVGPLNEAKGLESMKQMFPNGDIVIVGPAPSGDNEGFGQQMGKVGYEEIARYMNRARNFVFLPRWPEPMGRVVVEAALCGCNLVTNDNVGATSFAFDIGDPGNLMGAADEFWARVEAVVAGKREDD
ncbi:MAG: glycosyltransferase family protein [Thermoleophilia bacterium]